MHKTIRNILQKSRHFLERKGYSINPIDSTCWEDQRSLLRDLKISNVVDVGANVGLVAQKYRKLFPTARIVCVEPIKELAEQVRVNCPTANVHQIALSANDGEADFHINASRDTSSLLMSDLESIPSSYAEIQREIGVRKIPTRKLDTLAAECNIEQISVLKMDIQGGELAALEGASNLLRNANIDIIYTEVFFLPFYINQPLFGDLLSRLAEDKYALHGIYNYGFSGRSGKLQWADAIFVAPHVVSNSRDLLRDSIRSKRDLA